MTGRGLEQATIEELVAQLETRIGDSRGGLPYALFRLVSRLTPMVNVDLLIRNQLGQTMLTWRADEFYGPGWHIPGGIIRFKEHTTERIAAVARSELGAEVAPALAPVQIAEIVAPQRDVRGHFISLLYPCTLISPPDPELMWSESAPIAGGWRWFDACPADLIRVHEIYRDQIGREAHFLRHPSQYVPRMTASNFNLLSSPPESHR